MSDSDAAAQGAASGIPQQHQAGGLANQPARNENNASFLRAARSGKLDLVLEHLRNGTDINTCNSNGLNALHLASKEGHHEVVRELLRRGAIVDSATRKGNTALHIASLAGQDIIVAILVENGANPNAQSLNGFTPLYMAAQENHERVVGYLLRHNANQVLATEDGFTPLAVALQQGHDRIVALLLENDNNSKVKLPALHIAAKKDDIKAASLLLQNEQNADVTSKSGFTPLHIAAHYGNENVAQLLLEKGAKVNYQARHNISPLHVAAKWGRNNLCSLLLAHGAIIDCRTRDLLTPLHCAARSGHDQVVDLLLEKGAPIAAKTKNGLAPLHMAAQGDHVECARILLFHRAHVDDVTVDYLTPLHVAAHCGHVRVAKLLLDRSSDPNARALNGFTPLHIACKKNRIKVVELLLKYQAAIEATTESGLSPLHVASFMGCTNIVIFLIQQGANVDVETVRGETPLHLAARANQTDIVRVLVRNGAKVDAQARELQTPLHIAARLGNTDICGLLLSAGANANAATKDQYTPLHIAAKEGQEEVAVLLLDHKADKKLFTKKGFTPLHLACKYGNYDVAKLLLDQGTPVDIQGKNQVTPLHVAAHYNNDRVAQLLLENGASSQASAKNGYTPLHIAAKKNQMDIASFLLQYKADPNAESRAGFTPLHLASEEGHREMAALLMENRSNPNAQAKNGLTPMHLCAQEDRVQVAGELLQNGADVNGPTKAGYTPLHVACHFGQINMVKFLIENGADIHSVTNAQYTPLHQAAQQGHNNVCKYLLEHGASPNTKTSTGQTPLSIAQRLGYVSVVETLKTVTETTIVTETTTVTEERYKPHNPEGMNEAMFSDSEEEPDDTQAHTAEHAKDFNESITQGLRDSATIHLIHTGEQGTANPMDNIDMNLDEVIKRAQNAPVTTAIPDSSFLDNGHDDNVVITHDEVRPSFLISFLVDARGGAMRGCRHSGVRVIIPPRKAAAPMRITCRYLRKEKLAHPPPLSEGEALASRVLEMGPHNAKFLGPVILEVPHFASLRGREREIVILRSDDGQHWKEHQLEATEDAVQEVLNESFDTTELQQLDDLHTSRITRILTNDFPMYFAVVTRVRQEVHCVGPEGGVILSSVVPRVQAIFPDGSLTKTIKVSLQAQPVPQEIVAKLHGNRVAVSPIVTVEPRRRKFHKPITLCIPLPQSAQSGMINRYQTNQPGAEPPTLRLLCSITGGSSPAQWEDITGTTQLTFTGEEVSFTTTVSARFWLMDTQTPRNAAAMAQEVYNEAIAVPYIAKFAVFARRPYPVEGQLRLFCMTDDKEDKTLEKQENFMEVAKSREVEVLSGRHQFLEFAGNILPITKSGDQLSIYFLPFQENRLGFNVKVRQHDDEEAASAGRIAIMKEARIRAENIPPQHPICTLTITLPDYSGPLPQVSSPIQQEAIGVKYAKALSQTPTDATEPIPIAFVARHVGADWPRLARALQIPDVDIRQIKREFSGGNEPINILKIWIYLKGTEATPAELQSALRRIGRDDIVHRLNKNDLDSEAESLKFNDINNLRGSNYSSKVSVDRDYDKSEPHTSEINKTVTRTERYVHESEQGPAVNERTVTTTFKDEKPVDRQESERKTKLNDDEHQQWHGKDQLPIDDELITNSRHAMITTQEERTDNGIKTTTTLVTSHVVPDEEAVEEDYPQTIHEEDEYDVRHQPIQEEEIEEHEEYQQHEQRHYEEEEDEPVYVPPTQERSPQPIHEDVHTFEVQHHEADVEEPSSTAGHAEHRQGSFHEEEIITPHSEEEEERPESADTVHEVSHQNAEAAAEEERSSSPPTPHRRSESAKTPERRGIEQLGMSSSAIVANPPSASAISSFSQTTPTNTTFTAAESSSLPVVFGLTATGQPLIQNLVLSPLPADKNLEEHIEQPPTIPQSDESGSKLTLILSGILSNGQPIVQGSVLAQEIDSFNNAHLVSESSEGVNKANSQPATPVHSEASGDLYVIIQGGVTDSGLPLIQGLTLIPGVFSEAPQTATPPPSLTGEGGDYFIEKEGEHPSSQPPQTQPPSERRPLFDCNQSIPDFQSDNAQEEECVVVQAQQQGIHCNDDEFLSSHKPLRQSQPPQEPNNKKAALFHHSIPIDDTNLSKTLSYILSNLAKLKMVNQSQYSDVVEHLYELEDEMKGAATGLPPDQGLTELIGKILAAEYPNADLQIIVSSSRKTTTTKSFYETETPGMVGLEPEKLQELQRKLMTNISSPESAKDAETPGAVPPGLHVPDVEINPDAAIQKKEVHEEGYANNDGSEVVAKKMTRVITTSQSAVSGVNEQPPPYESCEDSDTASISNVSLGSVRDRIAIFESLKEKESSDIHHAKSDERRESTTLPAAVEAGIVGAAVATFDQMSTTSSKPDHETFVEEEHEEAPLPMHEEEQHVTYEAPRFLQSEDISKTQPDTDENVITQKQQSEAIENMPVEAEYLQRQISDEKIIHDESIHKPESPIEREISNQGVVEGLSTTYDIYNPPASTHEFEDEEAELLRQKREQEFERQPSFEKEERQSLPKYEEVETPTEVEKSEYDERRESSDQAEALPSAFDQTYIFEERFEVPEKTPESPRSPPRYKDELITEEKKAIDTDVAAQYEALDIYDTFKRNELEVEPLHKVPSNIPYPEYSHEKKSEKPNFEEEITKPIISEYPTNIHEGETEELQKINEIVEESLPHRPHDVPYPDDKEGPGLATKLAGAVAGITVGGAVLAYQKVKDAIGGGDDNEDHAYPRYEDADYPEEEEEIHEREPVEAHYSHQQVRVEREAPPPSSYEESPTQKSFEEESGDPYLAQYKREHGDLNREEEAHEVASPHLQERSPSPETAYQQRTSPEYLNESETPFKITEEIVEQEIPDSSVESKQKTHEETEGSYDYSDVSETVPKNEETEREKHAKIERDFEDIVKTQTYVESDEELPESPFTKKERTSPEFLIESEIPVKITEEIVIQETPEENIETKRITVEEIQSSFETPTEIQSSFETPTEITFSTELESSEASDRFRDDIEKQKTKQTESYLLENNIVPDRPQTPSESGVREVVEEVAETPLTPTEESYYHEKDYDQGNVHAAEHAETKNESLEAIHHDISYPETPTSEKEQIEVSERETHFHEIEQHEKPESKEYFELEEKNKSSPTQSFGNEYSDEQRHVEAKHETEAPVASVYTSEMQRRMEIESEPLHQTPSNIPYPYYSPTEESPKHFHDFEEELTQPVISEYPIGIHEGETEELQKINEIIEESLPHRPHDVPYPDEEEGKGPGLATKIAGAVAGVTVGGAILAYQKVKNAIGGTDDDSEDHAYPRYEDADYEDETEIHKREPVEAHYFHLQAKEEREAPPPSYEEAIGREHFEEASPQTSPENEQAESSEVYLSQMKKSPEIEFNVKKSVEEAEVEELERSEADEAATQRVLTTPTELVVPSYISAEHHTPGTPEEEFKEFIPEISQTKYDEDNDSVKTSKTDESQNLNEPREQEPGSFIQDESGRRISVPHIVETGQQSTISVASDIEYRKRQEQLDEGEEADAAGESPIEEYSSERYETEENVSPIASSPPIKNYENVTQTHKRNDMESEPLQQAPQDIPYPEASLLESPETFEMLKQRPMELETSSGFPTEIYESEITDTHKRMELEAEPLHQAPRDIPYPEYSQLKEPESSKHFHGFEEEITQPVISEYPTNIHEGETEELHKLGEIVEEPLHQRPQNIPYPVEKEDKGPGLATKIAGAVAGVTVGGAILAYQKVKDAIGGGDDNEDVDYPEEEAEIHEREPAEAKYFHENDSEVREASLPPSYEESLTQKSFETESGDPYLTQYKREHGDITSEEQQRDVVTSSPFERTLSPKIEHKKSTSSDYFVESETPVKASEEMIFQPTHEGNIEEPYYQKTVSPSAEHIEGLNAGSQVDLEKRHSPAADFDDTYEAKQQEAELIPEHLPGPDLSSVEEMPIQRETEEEKIEEASYSTFNETHESTSFVSDFTKSTDKLRQEERLISPLQTAQLTEDIEADERETPEHASLSAEQHSPILQKEKSEDEASPRDEDVAIVESLQASPKDGGNEELHEPQESSEDYIVYQDAHRSNAMSPQTPEIRITETPLQPFEDDNLVITSPIPEEVKEEDAKAVAEIEASMPKEWQEGKEETLEEPEDFQPDPIPYPATQFEEGEFEKQKEEMEESGEIPATPESQKQETFESHEKGFTEKNKNLTDYPTNVYEGETESMPKHSEIESEPLQQRPHEVPYPETNISYEDQRQEYYKESTEEIENYPKGIYEGDVADTHKRMELESEPLHQAPSNIPYPEKNEESPKHFHDFEEETSEPVVSEYPIGIHEGKTDELQKINEIVEEPLQHRPHDVPYPDDKEGPGLATKIAGAVAGVTIGGAVLAYQKVKDAIGGDEGVYPRYEQADYEDDEEDRSQQEREPAEAQYFHEHVREEREAPPSYDETREPFEHEHADPYLIQAKHEHDDLTPEVEHYDISAPHETSTEAGSELRASLDYLVESETPVNVTEEIVTQQTPAGFIETKRVTIEEASEFDAQYERDAPYSYDSGNAATSMREKNEVGANDFEKQPNSFVQEEVSLDADNASTASLKGAPYTIEDVSDEVISSPEDVEAPLKEIKKEQSGLHSPARLSKEDSQEYETQPFSPSSKEGHQQPESPSSEYEASHSRDRSASQVATAVAGAALGGAYLVYERVAEGMRPGEQTESYESSISQRAERDHGTPPPAYEDVVSEEEHNQWYTKPGEEHEDDHGKTSSSHHEEEIPSQMHPDDLVSTNSLESPVDKKHETKEHSEFHNEGFDYEEQEETDPPQETTQIRSLGSGFGEHEEIEAFQGSPDYEKDFNIETSSVHEIVEKAASPTSPHAYQLSDEEVVDYTAHVETHKQTELTEEPLHARPLDIPYPVTDAEIYENEEEKQTPQPVEENEKQIKESFEDYRNVPSPRSKESFDQELVASKSYEESAEIYVHDHEEQNEESIPDEKLYSEEKLEAEQPQNIPYSDVEKDEELESPKFETENIPAFETLSGYPTDIYETEITDTHKRMEFESEPLHQAPSNIPYPETNEESPKHFHDFEEETSEPVVSEYPTNIHEGETDELQKVGEINEEPLKQRPQNIPYPDNEDKGPGLAIKIAGAVAGVTVGGAILAYQKVKDAIGGGDDNEDHAYPRYEDVDYPEEEAEIHEREPAEAKYFHENDSEVREASLPPSYEETTAQKHFEEESSDPYLTQYKHEHVDLTSETSAPHEKIPTSEADFLQQATPDYLIQSNVPVKVTEEIIVQEIPGGSVETKRITAEETLDEAEKPSEYDTDTRQESPLTITDDFKASETFDSETGDEEKDETSDIIQAEYEHALKEDKEEIIESESHEATLENYEARIHELKTPEAREQKVEENINEPMEEEHGYEHTASSPIDEGISSKYDEASHHDTFEIVSPETSPPADSKQKIPAFKITQPHELGEEMEALKTDETASSPIEESSEYDREEGIFGVKTPEALIAEIPEIIESKPVEDEEKAFKEKYEGATPNEEAKDEDLFNIQEPESYLSDDEEEYSPRKDEEAKSSKDDRDEYEFVQSEDVPAEEGAQPNYDEEEEIISRKSSRTEDIPTPQEPLQHQESFASIPSGSQYSPTGSDAERSSISTVIRVPTQLSQTLEDKDVETPGREENELVDSETPESVKYPLADNFDNEKESPAEHLQTPEDFQPDPIPYPVTQFEEGEFEKQKEEMEESGEIPATPESQKQETFEMHSWADEEKQAPEREMSPSDYPTTIYEGETSEMKKRNEFKDEPLHKTPQNIPYPENEMEQVDNKELIQTSPPYQKEEHKHIATDYPTDIYEGDVSDTHRRMEMEAEPLHHAPSNIPYPITTEEPESEKHFNDFEEEITQPVISEYPTNIHEGETEELHKVGEIVEEPLHQRPQNIPYPVEKEDKGPGLATKIAGAVAGVTVGGAILAYQKVKDAIGGGGDNEDRAYPRYEDVDYPEEEAEIHEREPAELKYFHENDSEVREASLPPSYEETTAQKHFEEESGDPYLVKYKHEHGDLISKEEHPSTPHSEKTTFEHGQYVSPIGHSPGESEKSIGEPMTESQIADTPEDEKITSTFIETKLDEKESSEKDDYELIETGDVANLEEVDILSPRMEERTDSFRHGQEKDARHVEHEDTDRSQEEKDPMTQSVHPDYLSHHEASESPDNDNFELIETADVSHLEESYGHKTSPPAEEEQQAKKSPSEEDEWQKITTPEESKSLHRVSDVGDTPLENKPANVPYPSTEHDIEDEQAFEKIEIRLGENDGDEESIHHHFGKPPVEEFIEEKHVTEMHDREFQKVEKPSQELEEEEESDVEMKEIDFTPEATSTHKIEEHAEELVRDVLEQIETENLMEMSQDSLNFQEEQHPRQPNIPKIAEDEHESELFEDAEMEDSLNAKSGGKMLCVQQDIPAFRPSSPIPPNYGRSEEATEEEHVADEQMEVDSLNGDNGSSGEASVVDTTKQKKHTSYDNVSESSLQEFERLEYEIHEHGSGDSPTSEGAEFEKVVESQAGSISSLVEFENIEREVREKAIAEAANAEEVMMLSDIREESDIEEMSVREDDENEEDDSLSERIKPPQIGLDERQSHYPVETMITSTDSLEAVNRQHQPNLLLETSTDSLDPRHPYSPNQNEYDEYSTQHQADQDSLLEGVSQSGLSQETQMLSGDTVATYQEYQDDNDDDNDSLTEALASYPTTLTTFNTVQRKDDGSVETISRRVMTRVTDPIHSRVRFTGTEDEQRLHNIPFDHPVETVDEEGNVTITQFRRTPTP